MAIEPTDNQDDQTNVVVGTAAEDVLTTEAADDVVAAAGGDDVVSTGAGDDTVTGGGGDDVIETGGGNDYVLGGSGEDTLVGDETINDESDVVVEDAGHDRLEGQEGDDVIAGNDGNDLLVGGGAGSEWQLVDGKWVYNAAAVSSAENDPYFVADGSDDSITGGSGDDVLLGNAGADTLDSGSGDDLVNAGTGHDRVFGRGGNDRLNLDRGNDYAAGGRGDDVVNAGSGDDVVYGDSKAENLLQGLDDGAASFSKHTEGGAWSAVDDPDTGLPGMTQTIETNAGQTYTLNFELASNMNAGFANGTVEVLWNGEVVETITANGAEFQTYSISIEGTGEPGALTFRNIDLDGDAVPAGPDYNLDGPIASYSKTIEIGGDAVDVAAFAPAQAKLYQVIAGQLKVFDVETNDYVDAGDPTGLKINAIGFNVDDDLIYGIAKADGTDALGNPVSVKDLVVMDAEGNAYRIGETPVGDYVGDFDDQGNLWTFDASLNRITVIDVDNLDADGNPVVVNYYPPDDLMLGKVFDIAFNADEGAFYAVQAPGANGEDGQVHRIDVANYDGTGAPDMTTIPISGTLFEGTMTDGMPAGAFGAVFMDGDGNLYAGLNKGDHDLDGSTDISGAIYKIEYDFDAGQAYAEFMSESEVTGSNDGAVDPRSSDPFAVVDADATVRIRQPEVLSAEGGNDDLRGGEGHDEMWGNAGNDTLHGGVGRDTLGGDEGDDYVSGGDGADEIYGGLGDDFLSGDKGADTMSGGEGSDFMKGGEGADVMDGGADNDTLYGEDGHDVMSGGEGDDKIYGGVGDDWAEGGAGNDTINLGSGNDMGFGGAGKDFMLGGSGNDLIDGGGGNDKLVGGAGSDTIVGGAGDDHIWGGQWWKDGASDTFVYSHGGGKDTIHDFEVQHDQIDLSAYGLSYEDIQDRIIDRGWATEINLEGIDMSGAGDKILLKSVNPNDLDESNFIM